MQINITPVKLAEAAQQVSAKVGHPVDLTAGTLSHDGATVKYSYDGVGVLTIDVLSKPFYLSEGFVERQISGWFSAN